MAYISTGPLFPDHFGPFLQPIESAVVDELGPVRAHLVRVQVVDEVLRVEIVSGDRDLELVEAIVRATIAGVLPTGVGEIPVDVIVYPAIGGKKSR